MPARLSPSTFSPFRPPPSATYIVSSFFHTTDAKFCTSTSRLTRRSAWTAQQIIEAFPEDTTPRFLLRDRDQIYGEEFRRRVKGMQIEEVITTAQSPWQNAYAERLIGSVRRECLDHIIVLSEEHLRDVLKGYFRYYNTIRPHQALERNSPIPRAVESERKGSVISIPEVGGLHHRYQRAA